MSKNQNQHHRKTQKQQNDEAKKYKRLKRPKILEKICIHHHSTVKRNKKKSPL
ncbi:predicted protein [Plenodomus lingam JN3]|uniref:Predicted protein n=1 Tax=Leptosphaeria maculans (strain JN3 / isolate v23.1.3 / race Av1-4-5-6-7-8) TaxID=985895 RepID=E5A469_LEPMJ|nr:predicted protein [Plenodomus lingam JN3]CBX98414.1 predicted protein [Plenodomus lingam JN3]